MTMSLSKWWAVVSVELMFIFFMVISGKTVKLPWRFRKAGRVWCGGARETHWATCYNEVTPSKTKEFLNSPFFKILMVYDMQGLKKYKNALKTRIIRGINWRELRNSNLIMKLAEYIKVFLYNIEFLKFFT